MKGAVSSSGILQQPPVRSRIDGAAVLPQQPYQPCEPYDGIVLIPDYTSVMPFKVCMSLAGLIRRMTFFSTTPQTIFFSRFSLLTASTIARIISNEGPAHDDTSGTKDKEQLCTADQHKRQHQDGTTATQTTKDEEQLCSSGSTPTSAPTQDDNNTRNSFAAAD
jgi:hypothetical protein